VLLHLDTILDEPLEIDTGLVLGELSFDRQRIVARETRLVATAERTGRGVELRGRLRSRLTLDCVRCLEPAPAAIDGEVFLTLVPDALEYGPPDAPVADADATLFYATRGRVDLAALAAEQIYLNLPAKPLCTPDCKGLCPACGANRNRLECGCRDEASDPRLAPLLEFRKTLGRS
jgi:uncharacterized protein